MAFSDFLIRIGLDSSKFSQGSRRMGQDTSAVRQSIATLNATLAQQVQSMNTMVRQGRQGTALFQQLSREVRKTEGALKMMERQLDGTGGKIKDMGGVSASEIGSALTGGLIGGGVAGLVTAGASAFAGAVKDSISVAISFDDSIRKVGATSGATAKQLSQLRAAALEMGSKTRFTASQAAEALNYMALAGWNSEQSISALPGVLDLAAAAGTDLAMTSDILTDTMSAFGMEAKDSSRVADVFAQVQSKANTTVEMLGEAMKYAAPQFASAGQSIETTSTIIGLLANQGIKASMAGTAMNAMLKDVKKSAEDGSLSFGKMNVQLYDQRGNMRNMLDIIRDMRKGVSGMSQAQRDAITGGIFEERSIKAINILLNSTDETINKLEESLINATNRSKEMAAAMEGGAGGGVRELNSNWERFQINMVGSGGAIDDTAGSLSKLVQGMGTLADSQFVAFTTGEDAKMMTELYGRSMFVTASNAEIAAYKQEQLANKMQELYGNINQVREALDKMDWTKMTPPEVIDYVTPRPAKEGEAPRVNLSTIKGIKEHVQWLEKQKEAAVINSGSFKKYSAEISVYQKKLADLSKKAEKKKEIKFEATLASNLMTADQFIMSDILDTMRKEVEGANLLQGVFGNANMLQVESEALGKAIKSGIEAGVSQVDLQPLIDRFKELDIKIKGPDIVMDESSLKMSELVYNMQEELKDANILHSIFGNMDMIAVEMQSVGQLIKEGLEAGLDPTMLQTYIEQWKALSVEQQKQQAFASVVASIGDSAYQAFESIGAGAMSASEGVRAFGVAAISASLDAARGALVESIMNNAAKLTKVLGPIGIPLAVAASSALFGLLKGAIGKSKGVRLAEGGIISGRTMAEVGEYPGAAFNPEVVAPLDKLQAMLDIGGSTHVTGTFRVQGSDLVLALDNAQRKMNQFRV